MRPRPQAIADLLERNTHGVQGLESSQGALLDRPDHLAQALDYGRRLDCRLQFASQPGELKDREFARPARCRNARRGLRYRRGSGGFERADLEPLKRPPPPLRTLTPGLIETHAAGMKALG